MIPYRWSLTPISKPKKIGIPFLGRTGAGFTLDRYGTEFVNVFGFPRLYLQYSNSLLPLWMFPISSARGQNIRVSVRKKRMPRFPIPRLPQLHDQRVSQTSTPPFSTSARSHTSTITVGVRKRRGYGSMWHSERVSKSRFYRTAPTLRTDHLPR